MNKMQYSYRAKIFKTPQKQTFINNFVNIQKALTRYQNKKFHPRIQNFKYMSVRSVGKHSPYKRISLNKQSNRYNTQILYGALPQIFKRPTSILQSLELSTNNKLKNFNVSQITQTSTIDKESYMKFSKIKNNQKKRKFKTIAPKTIDRFQKIQQKSQILELFGHQIQKYLNEENIYYSKSMNDFNNKKNQKKQKICQSPTLLQKLIKTPQKTFKIQNPQNNQKTQKSQKHNSSRLGLHKQDSCKKYQQLEIQQFLQQQPTNLTSSQKRRITQFKKRQKTPQQLLNVTSSGWAIRNSQPHDQLQIIK